ncbi:MAG: S49 family peptidase, partial [Myxococcales bacterium]
SERLKSPDVPLVSILPPQARDPFLEVLGVINRLRGDDRVGGVLLRVGAIGELGHARIEELRNALADLRTSGKRVVALVMDAEDNEYLLATAAEKIYAVPQATFLVNGYSASSTFLAGALDKLGVTVDVARVGAYKNAPDQYTRTDMSAEQREVLSEFLDGLYGRYVAAVSRARGLQPQRFSEILSQGILSADAALKAGLVD